MPVDPRILAAMDAPLKPGGNAPKFRERQGFAAAPGTGPYGETCGSCSHFRPDDCSKNEWHCGLAGHRRGDRRPWRAAPACSRWESRHA